MRSGSAPSHTNVSFGAWQCSPAHVATARPSSPPPTVICTDAANVVPRPWMPTCSQHYSGERLLSFGAAGHSSGVEGSMRITLGRAVCTPRRHRHMPRWSWWAATDDLAVHPSAATSRQPQSWLVAQKISSPSAEQHDLANKPRRACAYSYAYREPHACRWDTRSPFDPPVGRTPLHPPCQSGLKLSQQQHFGEK